MSNRSMIQVSGRSFDGFITDIRIHDLLHDLAIQKAKNHKFLIICSKIDDVQNCSQTRRLAIHYDSFRSREEQHEDEELYGKAITSATPNLRSLISFGLMPKVPKLTKLKVLCALNYTFTAAKLEELGRLRLLRFFELDLNVKSNEDVSNFQKSIGGMRFLQTLILQGEWKFDLPDSIWHSNTLRNVMLSWPRFTCGPPPSADLKNLQTLSGVTNRESWVVEGLPKLPNVKILEIGPENRFHWDTITSLLGTLDHLISLQIIGDDIPLNIIDMRGFPFYQNLTFLDLWNRKELHHKIHSNVTLDVGMFPIHLAMLRLRCLQFRQDPMPALEKLENLRSLYLEKCKFKRLYCSAGGFGQLEELEFSGIDVEEWKLEAGAMPMLKQLVVYNCPQSCVPLGLEHLTVLRKLIWHSWNPDHRISETMENEIRTICKHVPYININ